MSKKKDIESIHYLSPLQEGLLFHAVSDAAADPYFTQTGFVIDGQVELGPFERAWRVVVERHPILRTGFVWDGVKKPMQVARRDVQVPLQVLDWRTCHGRQRDEALAEFFREDRRTPFDLLTPPMMRLTLIRIEDDRWYFINSHHHILLDGWSVALLLREVLTCYEAFKHGRRPVLPPVSPYAEYLTWLQGRNLESAESFWRNGLAEFATPTPLPLDAPQESTPDDLESLPFAEQEVRLSKAEVETLTAWAKRRRLTLNTLVQGAWSILLHRCTGDRDVLFGATVSGRPAEVPGSDVMVGLFINTLPVRISMPPDAKLGDWLAAIQEQNILLRQYEWTPLSRIQRWSGVQGGRPLFDSIVVFESYPEDESGADQLGIRITPMTLQRQDAEYVLTAGRNNYPLSLMVEPAAEVRLILSYARRRFAHGDIRRLLGYYRTLLIAMVEQHEARLSDLSPLTDPERRRLLVDWNTTALPVDEECVHHRIERQAHERPDATAVIYEGHTLTYGELSVRADLLARYLQGAGVGPDVRVGLCVERSLDLIIGLLGVLKAGGAYVALDPKLPKERLAFMLGDSGVRVVLTQAAAGDLTAGSSLRQVCLDRDWPEIAVGSDRPLRRDVRPENLAYVIYTSGSTGRPKGVAVEHRQVVNYVSGLLARLSLEPDAAFATVSTVAADLGNTSIFGSLCSGRTLHVLSVERGFDPDAVAEYMADRRIDVLKIVPSHLAGLLEARRPEHVLPRCCLILGGEAVHTGLVERIRALAPHCDIVNHYGPTETTVGVLTHRIGAEAHPVIPIGRPLANSQVFILGSDGQPTPVGVSGELYIGGDGLARGYLDRPDLTAERFVPDPFGGRAGGRLYRTGDRARYRPDGTVEFHGRADNQVKVRGFRIELGEIEVQLRGDGRLKDAVVVVREAADGTKQLAGYVVAARDLDLDSVRSRLAAHLPDYMMPSTFTVLDALPLTANGKIDRAALPDPERAHVSQGEAYVAPRNDAEAALAQIWADVLHLERVGIHDDFFTIGGDSILCLQVVAKAHRAGVKVSPKLVFQHHTVAAIAAALESVDPAPSEPAVTEASLMPFALAGVDPERVQAVLAARGGDLADLYPASSIQQGMLFHSLNGEDDGSYHNHVVYGFTRGLDPEAFEQAWQHAVDRHSVLRTGFLWDVAPEPLQAVFRHVRLPVERLDWRDLADDYARQGALHDYLSADRLRGFTLDRPPLMRLALIRRTEQSWWTIWSLHHAILDGSCQALLVQEVMATYESLRRGEVVTLKPAPPYREYIRWYLQQDLSAGEKFWREHLRGVEQPTRLPERATHHAVDRAPYGEWRLDLPAATLRALEHFARSQRVTLNTVIQGVWALLLARYSDTDDVLFGVTVSGRPRELTAGDAVLGVFINTMPLRLRVRPTDRLGEWLRGIQEVNVELRQYQATPLVQIQGWSDIRRGTSLFDSVLVFQNYLLDKAVEEYGRTFGVEAVDVEGWTNYSLTITVVPEERLAVVFSYDRRHLSDEMVGQIGRHWTALVERMIEKPDARLAELPILSGEERQRLLRDWNDSRRSYASDQCLSDLFEAQAARTPESIALSSEGVDLTYRELDAKANQLARCLMKQGVGPDVRVAICLERSLNLLVAILGVLKAGGAYVPLDPAYPTGRLAYMLNDSQVAVVVTQGPLLAAVGTEERRVLDLGDWERIDRESQDKPCVPCSSEQLAYVIYTSGSTGRPKGVMVRHAGAVNLLQAMQETLRFSSRDIVAATTSISFDIALLEWFLPLMVGARTVVMDRDIVVDGPRLAQELERRGATVMQATPSGWRLLPDAAPVPPVRVLCGGEAFPLELARKFLSKGLETWNLYGPTETTVWSMAALVKSADDVVPLGRPIANTQIYLLDSNFNLAPIGVPGELYIGGEGLARGYWQQPGLTAARFIPDPFGIRPGQRLYRTGDQARYRPDGTLEFLGRLDHQVKVRGYRIELGEIESALSRHPQVMRSVVVVRDEQGDKRIIAYVVPETGSNISPEELKRILHDQLPDYMVPATFVMLDEFPLTPNGKVDRKALPAPAYNQSNAQRDPGTPTEEILAGIWADVLSVKHVGVHDNFFELGGHSLLATQVVSRIRSSFQIELPLRSLFEAPTVTAMSGVIEQVRSALNGGPGAPPMPLTPAERGGASALSFAQQRLWFLAQMEPDGCSYNMPFALRLSGALDLAALSHSFEQVIARHEALRTTFREIDGEPAQIIGAAGGFSLPLDELSGLPEDRRDQAVREAAAREVRRPFRLEQDRPIRARLLRLDEKEHVLLVTLHHIAADAWSMTLLAHEVAVFYRAHVGQAAESAATAELPPLPVQYADFARWQRQWLQGPVLEAHLAYWKQRLGGNPPVLKLPADRQRPAVQTFRGARHVFTVPAEHADRLRALSRRHGVTLFMTLLAAFNTLLFRTTGQEDILVGTDVANRNRQETEGLVGFFVNLLPLRNDLSGNPTFLELLAQVRRTALEAYAHQDLPFEKIVEALKLKRDLGGNPLVQALLVLQNVPPPSMELPGLEVSALELESEVARFDLGLFMEEAEEGLTGLWKYSTDLFDASTVAALSERFATLLGNIAAQPEARLSAFEVLSHTAKESAMIESKQREEGKLKRFKSIQPKAVNLAQRALVERRYLAPDQTLPLVLQPAVDDVDLAAWAQDNRAKVEQDLFKHGAVLFRGFSIRRIEDFEQVAQALCPALFSEYGDLPREKAGRHVYGSTPYPADKAILFHNESSHLQRWPLKQSFFCVQAAPEGGETPIVDCRAVYERLRPELRVKFQERALMYVRNFTPGFDVSWQDFFHTEDKAAVEETCRQHGVEWDWTSDGGLRTRQVCPAIIKHPKTGEWVFFNQIQLHHVSYLEPAVRNSLIEVLGLERVPRNVYFGDGSPIDDDTAAEIGELYERTSVRFPWREMDLLMLDNMLVAHARAPFAGPRKIVVAMGDMISQRDVNPVSA